MVALLVLLMVPIFQIALLTLKIKEIVKLADGLIAVFTFILGIALTIVAWNLVEADVHPRSGPGCEIIPTAFIFAGLFITIIVTPVIELIFFIVRRLIRKKPQESVNIS